MKTQSAALERNGTLKIPASRERSIRVSRVQHDTGLTLKPVVLVYITPVVAISLSQCSRREQPIPQLRHAAKVNADFKDGVLRIQVPKNDKANTQSVEVKIA
jgi:Hsp20/alpha crystallin family